MAKQKQYVVVIDTGCANIRSVCNALERLGQKAIVSHRYDDLNRADKLLLPGVGSASEAMANMKQRDLLAFLADCQQPVLGICLGMQLLGAYSEEAGGENSAIPCLGFCDLPVKKMTVVDLPLPHMGWNQVTPDPTHSLFHNIPAGTYFYFVHSYAMPVAKQSKTTIATCCYGEEFSAAIEHDNYYGVQFHPERSGQMGSQLIKNFLELSV